MKFLRFLPGIFLWALIVAGVTLGIALIPAVQTWGLEILLNRTPGWKASIGSVSAHFGTLEITTLRLETQRGVLTVPSLTAELPLLNALVRRNVALHRLSAKGWTLDLSPAGSDRTAGNASAKTFPASGGYARIEEPAVRSSADPGPAAPVFESWMKDRNLPFDLSVDDVALEGDVILVGPEQGRGRLHVTVKGGGLATGRDGTVAIDAVGTGSYVDGGLQVVELSSQSQGVITLGTPRSLRKITGHTDLSASGGALPPSLQFAADWSVQRGVEEASYHVAISRSGRAVASVTAHLADATKRLAGSWKIDVREADLTLLSAAAEWPKLVGQGEGAVDADAALRDVHAKGHFTLAGDQWQSASPLLAKVGAATVEADFDLTRSRSSLRVDTLALAIKGDHPIARLRASQAFTFDLKTHRLAVPDPRGDAFEGEIVALPLTWLPLPSGGWRVASGELSGAFSGRAAEDGFSLHSKAPFTATAVKVESAGNVVLDALEVSVPIEGAGTPRGWEIKAAPLSVSRAGNPWLTLDSTLSRATQPIAPMILTTSWRTAEDTRAALPEMLRFGWSEGRSSVGELAVKFSGPMVVDGKMAVHGTAADRMLNVGLHAEIGANRVVAFAVPVKLSLGKSASDFTAEGSWSRTAQGHWVDVRIGGKDVGIDDLRLLAAPWVAAVGGSLDASPQALQETGFSALSTRDAAPFWGTAYGRVNLSFDQLRTTSGIIKNLRAGLKVERGAIRLETGLYTRSDQSLAKADGALSFDASAASPYQLIATLADGEFDGATIFSKRPTEEDAPFRGKFTFSSKVSGAGQTFNDLLAHTRQEFKLKSTSGIVRLLKTSVSGVNPEPATPVADALGDVGSLVGKLFGRKSMQSGEIHLSKNTEAVLNFTYHIAEIGYQDLTIAANETPDGRVQISELMMLTKDERITGSGKIDRANEGAMQAAPLAVDLNFAFRGAVATQLADADLLSGETDAQGFRSLKRPVHFGGTLDHPDLSDWHDLLASAAVRKPEAVKKDSRPATSTK